MRRIGTFESDEAAWNAISLLEAAGIPVFLQEGRDTRMGRTDPQLSVYLDSQFEDALMVLSDPNHVVRDPVDVEQFKKEVEAFDHSLILSRTLVFLAAAVAFFCVVALALYLVSQHRTAVV
jgi:hypothetical protein